ncbi:sensor histidine kinase [Desulfosoma caldarium]|uniref:histidine kinase n=1 Tax=Desulfosoma caldarium TaxID=610254 RepID=A0A3N1VJJ1_9BACT|nr:HAMP domain-containing sensor histidine kinase [Desulfosoma caldarium]ROR02986.1 signal transduction histidine kinase [Desulfosoma caldarium]
MLKTIQARILAISAISLILVASLGVHYWYWMNTIGNKLILSEQFEDLFNDMLEIRRFEKNFLLYSNPTSLEEGHVYLQRAEQTMKTLWPTIQKVMGQEASRRFLSEFMAYKDLIARYSAAPSSADKEGLEEVRNHGKLLVDFTERLLTKKRESIHKALKQAYRFPLATLVLITLVLVGVFRFVNTQLLKPLAILRETTARVAQGDFRPIEYESKAEDEISLLINAFNSMAQELEANQEALLHSRKIAALGTFTAGIAHELNNPLNNVYLTAEALLEDHGSSLEPEARELVLDILNQAERAAEIVKNLLDFSRTDRPKLEKLDITSVIHQTLKLVKNQLLLAGIHAEVKTENSIPLIQGHRRNLEQVFLNLFLNAIQAMPNGGEIRIRLSTSGTLVRIDVTDTGVGICPENLEHIFEPFYTTKGVGRGTGLGLSVTYSLIQKHGGYIEVQSEVGVGTTFSVFLPALDPETQDNEVSLHGEGVAPGHH